MNMLLKHILTSRVYLLALLAGCAGNPGIPVLDVASAARQSLEEFDVLEHASKITYISLETRRECLLQMSAAYKSGDDFVFTSGPYYSGQLYRFSSTGKFLAPVGKQGRGPKEYTYTLFHAAAPDGSEVVVGTGHEIIKHDRRGEMIKRLSLNSVKPALPDGAMKMDRFNRLYIRAHEKAYYENAVVVLDSSWKVIKEFPRSFVRDKTRGISVAKPIFCDDKYVYYKESMSDTLYGIDAKLERIPVAILDFGEAAARHDSFDSSAKLRGTRDLSAFYAFNSLWYFLAGESFVFLKRSRQLIHVKQYALTLHGVQWTPVGSTGNEWFLRAEAVDLLDHLDDITDPALRAIVERLDEADNPVLAVLEMK